MEDNIKGKTSFFKKPKPLDISFKDLGYSVKLKNGQKKQLLYSMNGKCKAGTVTALMGPSGAGKTTLLNVLSWRTGKNITGNIYIEDVPRKKYHKNLLGYVMQKDVFFSQLTVESTLMYTAKLRRGDLSHSQKKLLVDEAMQSLQLTAVRNIKVGDAFTRGLSGGELKRLNVANEFISNPAIIFMDEPTTGLDSTSAVALLEVANNLAKIYSINVILSIHQPSSQAFNMLHRVILISDGYIVYQGLASDLLSYLAFIGFPTPKGWNVSDYVMDLLYEENAKKVLWTQYFNFVSTDSSGNFYMTHKEKFLNSVSLQPLDIPSEHVEQKLEDSVTVAISAETKIATDLVDQSLNEIKDKPELREEVDDQSSHFVPKRPHYFYEIFTLLIRGIHKDTRGENVLIDLSQAILIALLVGVLWFQNLTEKTAEGFDDRIGFLYFATNFWMFTLGFITLSSFPNEKFVIAKERASKSFHISSYIAAKTFTDCLNLFVYPTIWTVIAFSMVGLSGSFGQLLGLWASFLFVGFISHSLSLAVSAMIEGMLPGSVVLAIYMLFSTLTAGFYIEVENIPGFLRWGRWISIITYSISLVTHVDMHNDKFTCDDYPGCIVSGDTLRQPFASGGSWAFDIGCLLIIWVIAKIITYFFLRYSNRLKLG